jgi:hypothetical protein
MGFEHVLNTFFALLDFGNRDEERRTRDDGGRMTDDRMAEDGSRLGLPEGGDGVGEFVLGDFDEFFAFRLQLDRHYISICVYTYGLY